MSGLQLVLKQLFGIEGGTKTNTNTKTKTKTVAKTKTVRQMIVLKNSHCYKHCLSQLQSLGIRPLKKVAGANAVVCSFPAAVNMAKLEAHAMVKRVEPERKFRIHAISGPYGLRLSAACSSVATKQIIPWGISRIEAPRVWSRNQGSPVRVAVLDTGINGTHPDLNVVRTYNTIAGTPSTDQNGHGTHVAGTIAALNNRFGVIGVAPTVRLYAVKAFDANGAAFTSDIVQGLDWCIRNNMQVINMSFGMPEDSATIREMIARAYRKGIVLVASAGNSGAISGRIEFPARLPQVIAVAASTRAGGIAGFSSRGSGISVSAPGVGICSTYPGRTYARLDGTSMASPHVTGTAALLLAKNRRLTPGRIRLFLQETALPRKGVSSRAQGAGVIRAKRAWDRA